MSKQDSPMKFFEKLNEGLTGNLNCCILGKINTFDGVKMKASIIPLVRKKDTERPMLIEVPVSFLNAGGFIIKPTYKKGDIVAVIFADEDIDNVLLSGNISSANSKRTHSLDDAIVIGSIMPFTKNMPSEYSNDLIISKDNFSSKIILKQNGAIEINSDIGVTITGPSRSSTW